jgi:N-acetylornithine carbamoyltransferase
MRWRCSEHFGGDLRGKKYVLTWTYHPKPLNTAVANSALHHRDALGMDVTLLCPTPEYVLDERYMDFAAQNVGRTAARSASATTSKRPTAAPTWSTPRAGARLPYFGAGIPKSPSAMHTSTSSSTKPRWR